MIKDNLKNIELNLDGFTFSNGMPQELIEDLGKLETRDIQVVLQFLDRDFAQVWEEPEGEGFGWESVAIARKLGELEARKYRFEIANSCANEHKESQWAYSLGLTNDFQWNSTESNVNIYHCLYYNEVEQEYILMTLCFYDLKPKGSK